MVELWSRVLLPIQIDVVAVSRDKPVIEKLVINNVKSVFIISRPKVALVYDNASKEEIIAINKPINNQLVEVAPILSNGLPTKLASNAIMVLDFV